jgi:hypothetical protein
MLALHRLQHLRLEWAVLRLKATKDLAQVGKLHLDGPPLVDELAVYHAELRDRCVLAELEQLRVERLNEASGEVGLAQSARELGLP